MSETDKANARVEYKDPAKKVWHLTSGWDDFIYFVAWIIVGAAVVFNAVSSAAMAGLQMVGFASMALFLIGVRLLMKIAGYLKRIEDLLSPTDPVDENASGELQRHYDSGAAGAC